MIKPSYLKTPRFAALFPLSIGFTSMEDLDLSIPEGPLEAT